MSAEAARIALKRVYDAPSPSDGTRVLVERLWPRGLSKERAHIDLWLREVAPSAELRAWYAHDVARWQEFRTRYLAELQGAVQSAAVDRLRSLSHQGPATLVFAARDVEHSSAELLRQVLADARAR